MKPTDIARECLTLPTESESKGIFTWAPCSIAMNFPLPTTRGETIQILRAMKEILHGKFWDITQTP